MTDNEYLYEVLQAQTLDKDGPEMQALHERRAEVEALLLDEFGDCSPVIRYGGSKAKGTMIRESYDLDIICYFPHDETGAGATLEEIFNSTKDVLGKKFAIEPKTSAIRLKDQNGLVDLRVDVVPGRFVEGEDGDVYLYQASGEKGRLKTNLDVHIAHVKDSSVTQAIRLSKLWRTRNGLHVKSFALELMVIELLNRKKSAPLAGQLDHVLRELRDNIGTVTIEDPANPTGNDLSGLLNETVRADLSYVARMTLDRVEASGWQSVFGPVEKMGQAERREGLRRAAAAVTIPTKPWTPGR